MYNRAWEWSGWTACTGMGRGILPSLPTCMHFFSCFASCLPFSASLYCCALLSLVSLESWKLEDPLPCLWVCLPLHFLSSSSVNFFFLFKLQKVTRCCSMCRAQCKNGAFGYKRLFVATVSDCEGLCLKTTSVDTNACSTAPRLSKRTASRCRKSASRRDIASQPLVDAPSHTTQGDTSSRSSLLVFFFSFLFFSPSFFFISSPSTFFG